MKTAYFILMLLVYFGINFYVIYRLVCMLPTIFSLRLTTVIIGITTTLSLLAYFFIGRFLPVGVTSVLYVIGTSWIMIAVFFAVIFLLMDICRIANILPMGKILYENWISFITVICIVVGVCIYGYYNYLDKGRVELDISVNKYIGSKPIKLVAISDLHLGYGIGKEELLQWVELINKEEPDAVLIAGDIVDSSLRPLDKEDMASAFRQIKSKYGVYACMGNHEYIADASLCGEFMEKAGIHMLRDEYTLVNNQFYVVGREDMGYYGRKPTWEMTDSLNKSKPIIVLDHQPVKLEEVLPFGVDLQISGHTHYGQIWPISWLTYLFYSKPYGYYHEENTHFYVTSGIGVWGGKFRVGTQSEYVVINLSGK